MLSREGAIARAKFDRKARHFDKLRECYKKALLAADPDLGTYNTFHVAHNWGNRASKDLLTRYNTAGMRVARGR